MKGNQFELSDKELEILTEHSGERVESGVYEWTPGKALKDCKVSEASNSGREAVQ